VIFFKKLNFPPFSTVHFFKNFIMGKRKSPPSKPPAKKKKAAVSRPTLYDAQEEKIQKMYEHIKLITDRSNLLQQHCSYLENKMREFARLVHRQNTVFDNHLSELKFTVQQVTEDVYRLAPNDRMFDDLFLHDQLTCPNSPLSIDGDMMSESEMIKAVGEFAQCEP
tara:strand:+ start:105 stop:602 length:498 start_codon:yes stop_codon:yes gene_type:complete